MKLMKSQLRFGLDLAAVPDSDSCNLCHAYGHGTAQGVPPAAPRSPVLQLSPKKMPSFSLLSLSFFSILYTLSTLHERVIFYNMIDNTHRYLQ